MDKDAEEVKTHFHNVATGFDSIYTGERNILSRTLDRIFRKDMYDRFNMTVEECINLLPKYPDLSVLDIGCGSGQYTIALAQNKVPRVVGIDFADNMLKIAEKSAKDHGVEGQCEFITGDFLDHPFQETFDVAIAIGLFDYIEDPMPSLTKMEKLCTKKLVTAFPRKWTWRAPIRKVRLGIMGCPVYFFTKDQVEKFFDQLGFAQYEIKTVGKLFFVTATK